MSRELTEDGLHPTADGHKVIGKNLAGQLVRILRPFEYERNQNSSIT